MINVAIRETGSYEPCDHLVDSLILKNQLQNAHAWDGQV